MSSRSMGWRRSRRCSSRCSRRCWIADQSWRIGSVRLARVTAALSSRFACARTWSSRLPVDAAGPPAGEAVARRAAGTVVMRRLVRSGRRLALARWATSGVRNGTSATAAATAARSPGHQPITLRAAQTSEQAQASRREGGTRPLPTASGQRLQRAMFARLLRSMCALALLASARNAENRERR